MSILRTDKIAGLDSVNAITGSVKFTSDAGAGHGTYLEVNDPDGTIKFGTGEFSIEFWMYANTTDTSAQENDLASILDYGYGSSNNTTGAWFALHQEDRTLHFGFNNANQVQSSNFLNANTWHHIAIQRQGGNTKIYGDGTQVATVADTQDYTDALFRTLQIGSQAASSTERNFDGYISNLRICKGHAVYNGAFTPPTRALEVHPGPDDDRTVVFCCYSSQDATQEATGKTLAPMPNSAGPLASTFVPDVGNDHTHGTVLEGGTAFSSLNYMTLPRGKTTQSNRGRALLMGNLSSAADGMKYFSLISSGNTLLFGDLTNDQIIWGGAGGSSTRGVIGGGSPVINTMEYVTTATTGNALNFGDLTLARRHAGVVGNDTRGCWGGGETANSATQTDTIDYITFATTGNAADFGNLTAARRGCPGGSSPTRGVFAGGQYETPSAGTKNNIIDYITIASTGDAADFGDLPTAVSNFAGTSSPTRAVWGGGSTPTVLNTIAYVEIASTGNAVDFGDLATTTYSILGACASHIRGMWTGGYTGSVWTNSIQFITIATTGNAAEWGDLITTNSTPDNERGGYMGATSDSHGGLS